MTAYTVIALIDPDSGDFLPAGVIEGDHLTADAGPQTGDFTRFAETYEANDAEQAIAMAESAWRSYVDSDSDEPGWSDRS